MGQDWRDASGRLTTPEFWQQYLNIEPAAVPAEAPREWTSHAA